MGAKIPKRISTALMNALKSGVVPRNGLGYIAVGRKDEINALLSDIEVVADGGASFRFLVGKYGSGKSFLLQTIRSHAMDKDYVVVDADLSPERRLVGSKGQGLATYKELMQHLSTKAKPDGGGLPLILQKWITGIQTSVMKEEKLSVDDPELAKLVEIKIFEIVNQLEGMVHGFDFARVITAYWKAYGNGDEEQKANALKWLRGEYATKSEAKRDLNVSVIISDEDWYEYLKLIAHFIVKAGYKGLIVLIDELVSIYKIPHSITRQNNYEKILTIFNDTLQGKAKYIGFIMCGTPQCIEDERKGLFNYEALKSRLVNSRFSNGNIKDMLAPIINLQALTNEEMYVLVEKLAKIHADMYEYEQALSQNDLIAFLTAEYQRIGADIKITPREIIRDFIELLNLLYQNPSMGIVDLMGADSFKFAVNEVTDEEIHKEFAGFEI